MTTSSIIDDDRLDIYTRYNAASSSSNNNNNKSNKNPKKRSSKKNLAITPDRTTPNVTVRYPPAKAAAEDATDLSADQPHYFSEARSTPIIYSSSVISSSSSSSLSEEITKRKYQQRREYDNRSLCSVHSGQQQQQQNNNNSSDNSSTRNQVFYFSTPLPPQKHQPYQYHGSTPATTSSSNNGLDHPYQQKGNKFKQLFTTKRNNNIQQTTVSGGASVKSAFSTGRQTIKSWRQKRINILLKKKQRLPDIETETFCDGCEKYITTRIRYRNGSMVWLVSFILLLCTVVLFWVPFYVKYFKDVAHFCPGCGKRIGVSYRL